MNYPTFPIPQIGSTFESLFPLPTLLNNVFLLCSTMQSACTAVGVSVEVISESHLNGATAMSVPEDRESGLAVPSSAGKQVFYMTSDI